MRKPFVFKGTTLEQGDIISVMTKWYPIKPIQAAVLGFNEASGQISLHSSFMEIRGHKGVFKSEDVLSIGIVAKYDKAIPSHTAARFKKGERAYLFDKRNKLLCEAIIIAAFEKNVFGEVINTSGLKDGEPVSGEAKFWKLP